MMTVLAEDTDDAGPVGFVSANRRIFARFRVVMAAAEAFTPHFHLPVPSRIRIGSLFFLLSPIGLFFLTTVFIRRLSETRHSFRRSSVSRARFVKDR